LVTTTGSFCAGRLSPLPPSIVTSLPLTVAVIPKRRPLDQYTSTWSLVTMPRPLPSVATPVSLSVRVVSVPAWPAGRLGVRPLTLSAVRTA
jgi:hypothetical protein